MTSNLTRVDLYEAVYREVSLSRSKSLAMVELVLKEITDCLEKCPKLSRYIIDTVECTKANVFIICHEKPVSLQVSGEREHLLLTGDAVLRVLNDPKLSKYEFDVGLKHS